MCFGEAPRVLLWRSRSPGRAAWSQQESPSGCETEDVQLGVAEGEVLVGPAAWNPHFTVGGLMPGAHVTDHGGAAVMRLLLVGGH